MPARPGDKIKSDSPGPGAYEHIHAETVKSRTPTVGLAKEPRAVRRGHDFPGPGSYESKHIRAGKPYGFGSEPRVKPEKQRSPGLIYNPPSTFAAIPNYQQSKSPGPILLSEKSKN